MQDLKIGLLQVDQAWQNPLENRNRIEAALKKQSGADLILIPEMAFTGFSMNAKEFAEEWDNSSSVLWLEEQSLRYNTALYTSLLITSGGEFYNRGVFVSEGMVIAHYDKQHLFAFAGEDSVFKPGNNQTMVTFKGWKINLQICFDLRFPEGSRNRVTEGGAAYDLLLYVANWPSRRIAHWDSLLIARAIENQSVVAAVNRVGMDGNQIAYNGHSCLIAADGNYIQPPIHTEEVLMIQDISYEQLMEFRKSLPFLKERKG
ncbi:MAG: nitrilase-related carbon-nitrogen hydrolase [Flavobacteriales bacterium]